MHQKGCLADRPGLAGQNVLRTRAGAQGCATAAGSAGPARDAAVTPPKLSCIGNLRHNQVGQLTLAELYY